MFPLPTQFPYRSQDYTIEIKGEPGPSKRPTAEEKGKAKAVNIISLEEKKEKEPLLMPINKHAVEARESRGALAPTKKRGKAKEGDDAATRKRKQRRHFEAKDFSLGEGQNNYNPK